MFLGFLRAGLGQQGQTAQLVTGGDRRFQSQELAGFQKKDPGWEHRSSLQLLSLLGFVGMAHACPLWSCHLLWGQQEHH